MGSGAGGSTQRYFIQTALGGRLGQRAELGLQSLRCFDDLPPRWIAGRLEPA